MSIEKRIQMEVKKESDLKDLDKMMKIAKEIAERPCNENPCNHEILVKFYGNLYRPEVTVFGQCKEIIDDQYKYHMCLGCKKLVDNIEASENNRNIIDLTNLSKIDLYDKSAHLMLSYLQVLVKEIIDKNPNFTDKDITDTLNNNLDKIKIPNDFNEEEELRKCYLH